MQSINVIIIFTSELCEDQAATSKIPRGSPTISKIASSTFIKTLRPVCTATSSKDRQTGAYSIGQTIPGKLNCTNRENKNT